jgi:proline racemase
MRLSQAAAGGWKRPATWTGALDRSPCGTGTCARMAALHAKGKLPLNQPFAHEGIAGNNLYRMFSA